MILHGTEGGMLVLDPDFALLEFRKWLALHEEGDAVEVVRQHAQTPASLFGVLALEESGVDVHGPPFDVLDHGIEAHALLGSLGLARLVVAILLGKDHRTEDGEEEDEGKKE
jgi:hypothetical protein